MESLSGELRCTVDINTLTDCILAPYALSCLAIDYQYDGYSGPTTMLCWQRMLPEAKIYIWDQPSTGERGLHGWIRTTKTEFTFDPYNNGCRTNIERCLLGWHIISRWFILIGYVFKWHVEDLGQYFTTRRFCRSLPDWNSGGWSRQSDEGRLPVFGDWGL